MGIIVYLRKWPLYLGCWCVYMNYNSVLRHVLLGWCKGFVSVTFISEKYAKKLEQQAGAFSTTLTERRKEKDILLGNNTLLVK